jgi:xanthine dehydrogenase YagT iron-sulfur-binding subunit
VTGFALLTINGIEHRLALDPRATLVDVLRERLGLTGTKKSCDRGECGACTVHLDGRPALACMVLAVAAQDHEVTTIEGVAPAEGERMGPAPPPALAGHLPREGGGEELHPVQEAFIDHDGFQCGYCTPGQIMSAIACVRDGHTGTDDEIREFMSGNICRCSAYPQIVAAVRAAAGSPD